MATSPETLGIPEVTVDIRRPLLVVDDEAGIREVLSERLALHGFSVETAASGFEALDLVRADPGRFALIISDVRMPNGSGIELLDSLGEIPTRPEIIFFSAFTDYTESQIIDMGGRGLLQKPIQFEELIALIESVTGNGT